MFFTFTFLLPGTEKVKEYSWVFSTKFLKKTHILDVETVTRDSVRSALGDGVLRGGSSRSGNINKIFVRKEKENR